VEVITQFHNQNQILLEYQPYVYLVARHLCKIIFSPLIELRPIICTFDILPTDVGSRGSLLAAPDALLGGAAPSRLRLSLQPFVFTADPASVPSLAADASGYQSYLFGSVRGSAVAAVDLMNRTASVALDNAIGAATMAAPLLSLEAEAAAVAFEFTASTSGYRFSIALTSSLLALFTQIAALGSLLYSVLRIAMRKLEYVFGLDSNASTPFESEMAESGVQFAGPRGAELVVSTAPTVGEIEMAQGVYLISDHDNASLSLPCDSALQVASMLHPNPMFSTKVEPRIVSASAAGASVASDDAVVFASHIDLNVANDVGVAHSEAAGISAGEDSVTESAPQPATEVLRTPPPPPHASRHKMTPPVSIDTDLAASPVPTLRSVATAPNALGGDAIFASPMSDHRAIPVSDPPAVGSAMVLLRALHPYTAAFDDELSTLPGTIVKVDVAATRQHGDDEWAVVTVVGGPLYGARGAVPLNHFEQFVSVP
jgi:hypothetical protein